MEDIEQNRKSLEFQQPSLVASLKLVCVEWCLSSTAHAIPNIFRTGNILVKIVWIICLMASTAYCIYSMIASLQQFLSYPTYFTAEIVQEIPAPFPAVTVCNIKTVNRTASMGYFSQPQFANFTINPNFTTSTFQYIWQQQYYVRTYLSNDKLITDAQKEAIGFELKDMLISCFFNYLDCSHTDFRYFYDPIYGNCYTFNSGMTNNGTKVDLKTVSLDGIYYGLIMEFYLGNPNVDTLFEFSDGIIMSIHNQSSPPFVSNKILAAANADTELAMLRSFTTKLPNPYGSCLDDISASSSFSSYYFDYIVKTLRSAYSQKYCFNLCLQKQIMNTCGCSSTYLPIFSGNVSYCFTDPEGMCVFVLVNNFGTNQANVECKTACPYECNSLDYELSIYRSLYPTKFYQKVLADYSLIKYNNISYENIPLAVAKVNVYYKSMEYRKTSEQIAITTEAFFSNMGGTLGLYIGISMLSLVEMVELVISLIIAGLGYSKARRQITSNEK